MFSNDVFWHWQPIQLITAISRHWSQTLAAQSCWRDPWGSSVSPFTPRCRPCKGQGTPEPEQEMIWFRERLISQLLGFCADCTIFSNLDLFLIVTITYLPSTKEGWKGDGGGRGKSGWDRNTGTACSREPKDDLFQPISQWNNQRVWYQALADNCTALFFKK